MNSCQKIQEFTDILLKSENTSELELVKINLLLLCEHIPQMTEQGKALKIQDLKNDLDSLLTGRKTDSGYKKSIERLRISMKSLFDCPDVRQIYL